MELYEIYKQHPEICTDSRNCPSGSLFFALKGDNFNANAYALSALEKGCAFAVIDEEQYVWTIGLYSLIMCWKRSKTWLATTGNNWVQPLLV